MSTASSFPAMRITPCPSPSSSFKFSAKSFIIRSSNADGPLRRPVAPPLSKPPSPPLKPVLSTPSPSPSPSTTPPKPVSVTGVQEVSGSNVVTLEFQRKMAKELQEYFRQKKLEEADQGPFFGFVGKNEITNGRVLLWT